MIALDTSACAHYVAGTAARSKKIADVPVAQFCIDHDIPLITYDRDFRHFQRAGLQLL